MKRILLYSLLCFFLFPAVSNAATIVVHDDGAEIGSASPEGDCVVPNYNSIQDAINAASPEDTISICSGTYTENISLDKPLSIEGPFANLSPAGTGTDPVWEGDQAIIRATTGSVMSISDGADGTSIKGLSFKSTDESGDPTSPGPIGIKTEGVDNLTIQNNYFYELYNNGIENQSLTGDNWQIKSNLITSPDPFISNGSYTAGNTSAIKPGMVNNLKIYENRINGYGRGIELEENQDVDLFSNILSNLMYHGIESGPDQTDTWIRGNAISSSQLTAHYASLPYPDGGVDFCTGAISLTADGSSSGVIIKNNLIKDTGRSIDYAVDAAGWCPAIRVKGNSPSDIAFIRNNSLSESDLEKSVGAAWSSTQILSASITANVATIETVAPGGLNIGETITIANLGESFNGTYTISSTPDSKTFTYAKTASDVSPFYPTPTNGAVAIHSGQVGKVDFKNNWWGSNQGPAGEGAMNAGGSSILTSPFIETYIADTTKADLPGFYPLVAIDESTIKTGASSNTFNGFFNNESVNIEFYNVVTPGTISIRAYSPSLYPTDPVLNTPYPESPSGFGLGTPPIYYTVDIETATFTGPAEVCLSYKADSFQAGRVPIIYHFTDGSWKAKETTIKTGPLACAFFSSFSPIALGVETNSTRSPAATQSPAISGEGVVGKTLTTTSGEWTGNTPITYTYKWQKSDFPNGPWTDIESANQASYKIKSEDVSDYIRAVIGATNAYGTASSGSEPVFVKTNRFNVSVQKIKTGPFIVPASRVVYLGQLTCLYRSCEVSRANVRIRVGRRVFVGKAIYPKGSIQPNKKVRLSIEVPVQVIRFLKKRPAPIAVLSVAVQNASGAKLYKSIQAAIRR